mgnify:CR=1 FL=1
MSVKSFFTSFFDSISDVASTFDFRNELRSHLIEKTYKNSLRDKVSFDAVILHVNEKTPQTSTTRVGMQYVAKVRPLDLHNFIIPEPCSLGNNQSLIKFIVSLHPTAYSNYHSHDISLTVGDIVECYYDIKGPTSQGQMRGLRFENKIKSRAPGNYSFKCLGLDASDSTQSSHDRRYYAPTSLPSGRSGASGDVSDEFLADVSFTGHAGIMNIIQGDLSDDELTCDKFPWITGGKYNKRTKKTSPLKYHTNAWCSAKQNNEHISTSHFMKINNDTKNNYRSAQPANDKNFFRFLKKEHKIERVVTLALLAKHRTGLPKNGFPTRRGPDKVDPTMRTEVEAAGLEYYYVKLNTNGPSSKHWTEIKKFLKKGNCLIHCTHGADRTGAVAGRWMVEEYGISCKDAYKDALKYGFKPYGFTYPSKPERPDANRALRYFIFTGRGKDWDDAPGGVEYYSCRS